ncbi:FCD domain-containing protein [Paraburkholderia lycopersici]|uniref:DNA-binding transcriptional regulator, GntR family n=1 Tax=Paraburkholderia lycopersici TaxID=416944 RepID=A0A1G6W6Y6_9BURK|nr:FCD domain-containing protein [Paraburkholderia lycopersici]SDD60795.1 DNA-binding transcriptional regulator, GntR family [Paraburkholderia lycopersici]
MTLDIKITPQTVLLQTTLKLREAIMQGHFAPGERLVELSLCERMGVSRTTIREALRRLESERLITNKPNRGPSVAVITQKEADHIYHVRKLLEGEAAALFAERATPVEVDLLQRALDDFEAAVVQDSAIGRVSSTSEFYEIILKGCGNPIIHEVIASLLARINVLRAKSMSAPGRARISAAEMRRMMTAIQQRNAPAARMAAEAHVIAARDAIRAAWGKNTDEPDSGADIVLDGEAESLPESANHPPVVPVVGDELWAKIETILPPVAPRRRQYPGRKPTPDRFALLGIIYVLGNRISWNHLPADLGCGSGVSCWRRMKNWQEAGVWPKVERLLVQAGLLPRGSPAKPRAEIGEPGPATWKTDIAGPLRRSAKRD